MDFVELDVGDIFLSWYDDTAYMKIPLCKQDSEVNNAVRLFGSPRGQLRYFTSADGVTLCDEVDNRV